jgi:hypothetical protein
VGGRHPRLSYKHSTRPSSPDDTYRNSPTSPAIPKSGTPRKLASLAVASDMSFDRPKAVGHCWTVHASALVMGGPTPTPLLRYCAALATVAQSELRRPQPTTSGVVVSLSQPRRLTASRQEFIMRSWKTMGARSLGTPNLTGGNALVGRKLHLSGWADSYCAGLLASPTRGTRL